MEEIEIIFGVCGLASMHMNIKSLRAMLNGI